MEYVSRVMRKKDHHDERKDELWKQIKYDQRRDEDREKGMKKKAAVEELDGEQEVDGAALVGVARNVPNRWWAVERMLAFAMARHARLGADSPARIVSKDVLRKIFEFVRPQERMIVAGGEYDEFWTNQMPLRCVYDLDLYSGRWRRLPDLPVALMDCAPVVGRGNELWLFGGRGETVWATNPGWTRFAVRAPTGRHSDTSRRPATPSVLMA